MIAVRIPLDDCGEDNGALRVVPGWRSGADEAAAAACIFIDGATLRAQMIY
jgi:hypothetical protein